jgi:hypothetical protein
MFIKRNFLIRYIKILNVWVSFKSIKKRLPLWQYKLAETVPSPVVNTPTRKLSYRPM